MNPKIFTKKAVAKVLKAGVAQDLVHICEPLAKLGINAFFYSRFHEAKRVNCLSNNFKWLQHLHDNILNYNDYFENMFHFRSGFSVDFLSLFSKAKMTVDLTDHGMKNAIYISNVSKDRKFSETFVFTTPENGEVGNQKLIDTLTALNQFCIFFKGQAHGIIQKTQLTERELGVADCPLNNPQLPTATEPLFAVKRYYLGAPHDDVYLTKKQFVYLREYLRGKTIKEAADICSVSPRTIEKQLELLRQKLNCDTKSKLIDIIFHSQLFYPIFLQ